MCIIVCFWGFLVENTCFYACFMMIESWKGGKSFRVGIFLSKNLLGYGYRKQTTFLVGCIKVQIISLWMLTKELVALRFRSFPDTIYSFTLECQNFCFNSPAGGYLCFFKFAHLDTFTLNCL